MFVAVTAALLLSAATPPPQCRVQAELRALETGDEYRRAATLLAEQGKWRVAATAQASVVESKETAGLLLAFYTLRAGDVDRAQSILQEIDHQSASFRWLAAELALARDDEIAAAEELELPRPAEPDAAFANICCRGQAVEPATVDALFRARIALLHGDTATALKVTSDVDLPEARLLRARALPKSEAVVELLRLAREVPPCAGVWREHVLFEAALLANDATLYEEAIAAAEAQEEQFTEAVFNAGVDLQSPVNGLFVAATRELRDAAPESRNNLGQFLIDRANGDYATLMIAEPHLRNAAHSRDYATPHYAYIGLARIALATDRRDEAADDVMMALWFAPTQDEALELARSLMRDASRDAQLQSGIVFTAGVSESLPSSFVAREYGRDLARLDDAVANQKDALSRQYAAVRAVAARDYSAAIEIAGAAEGEWPNAIEIAALTGLGRSDEAKALVQRALANPPRNAWDAATLRMAAIAFSDVAQSSEAKALVAEVARPLVGRSRGFPWEPRNRFAGNVVAGGSPLSGTAITIYTEDGPRIVKADAQGEWSAGDLPPGTYSILAQQSGLASRQIGKITAGETRIAMTLKPVATHEEIVVTDSPPLIDVLPTINRQFPEYLAALQGSDTRYNNIQVDGASVSDAYYLIEEPGVASMDGIAEANVSVTNTVNYFAVSSALGPITLITSDYSAEFGRDPIRGVSRSGSNTAHGQVTIEDGNDSSPAEPVAMPQARSDDRSATTVRAQAGGPVVRDRFWWFASVDALRGANETQPSLRENFEAVETRERRLEFFTKLTAAFTMNHSTNLGLRMRRVENKGTVNDPGGSAYGTQSSTNRRAQSDEDTLVLNTVRLTPNGVINLLASLTRDRTSLRPNSPAGEEMQTRFPFRGFATDGGVGFINDRRNYERFIAEPKFAYYDEHEVVVGGTGEWDKDTLSDRISAGQLLDSPAGIHRYWTYGDDPQRVDAVRETFKGSEISAYANDAWKVADNFTLSAGLRWTKQTVAFPADHDLSTDAFLPRVAVSFLVGKEKRTKLHAGYGRFFESIERDERVAYGSDRRYVIELPQGEPIAYGRLSAIDPSLRPRLTEDIDAGVQHGGSLSWYVGARHRRLVSHIEDSFCTPSRMRCITNPDSAKRRETSLYGNIGQHNVELGPDTRLFWGVDYVHRRATGNIDPPDLASTRVAGIDPYARIAFDTEDLVREGALGTTPRHSLKAMASLSLFDLIGTQDVVLTTALVAQSGAPRGAYVYSDLYGRYAATIVPRSYDNAGPSWTSLYAGIDYVIPLRDVIDLKLSISGQNLLNSQPSRVDDQRADLPTFLQPMERRAPRAFRALVTVTF